MTDEPENLDQAKIYLKPGEQAPKGYSVKTGPSGGKYYDSTSRGPAKYNPDTSHLKKHQERGDRKLPGGGDPGDPVHERLNMLSGSYNRLQIEKLFDTFSLKRSEVEDIQRAKTVKGKLKLSAIRSVARNNPTEEGTTVDEVINRYSEGKLPPVTVFKDADGNYRAVHGQAVLAAAWARKEKYIPVKLVEEKPPEGEEEEKDTHYFNIGDVDHENPNGTVKVTQRIKSKLEKKGYKVPAKVKTIQDLVDHFNDTLGAGSAEFYETEGDFLLYTPKKGRKFKE